MSALRDVLWMARSRGFKKISVEGNSKLMIDSILQSCNVPWLLKFIIEDLNGLATSFDFISWAHVYREANFLTDAITSTGFQFNNLHVWDRTLPNVAPKAYFFGCLRISCDHGQSYMSVFHNIFLPNSA